MCQEQKHIAIVSSFYKQNCFLVAVTVRNYSNEPEMLFEKNKLEGG